MDHVTIEARGSAARTTEPSTLFVHGFLGSASSWDDVRSHLSPRARTEALTLLGHGHGIDHAALRADDEASVASFDDEIARLSAHVDRLPRADTLVGYSLGARVALGLAARASRPFSRLVLVSGRDGLGPSDEAGARCDVDDALASTLIERGLPAFVDRWEALPLFESQRALPPDRRATHRERRLAHDPAGVARALRVLSLGRMPRYGRDAVRRSSRVDLVAGERDAKFVDLAHRFAEDHGRFGDVRVHVVPDAGHDVVLEQPAALAAILEDRV